MLKLQNILKVYRSGDMNIAALQGISLNFRKSEFVAVLGPSGCGKTTMLNIIGGLDQYTSGDLIINGKSTRDFKDRDWDAYRNHSIGFVFQNYNLIPHQTVLSNVELALTLSGVSKSERRKKATEALRKVGLGDQLTKKPNQMSGGQMQRVAIARALVNNPDILLADEPTGALDSATSVQIMELLKEIAKDKLVIMVTHNPELAERYATRIIRLLDGKILSDSNPYEGDSEKNEGTAAKKTSMSFFTALSLILNNLMTKKTRTFLTAFAGSIGIIGIALILAISSGSRAYIEKEQTKAVSNYPIQIEQKAMDLTALMGSVAAIQAEEQTEDENEDGKIYSDDRIVKSLTSVSTGMRENNLTAFKRYLEENKDKIAEYATDIQYSYAVTPNIFRVDPAVAADPSEPFQTNPPKAFEKIDEVNMGSSAGSVQFTSGSANEIWHEISANQNILSQQYDLLDGAFPASGEEAVLIVSRDRKISDSVLYALGVRDVEELNAILRDPKKEQENTSQTSAFSFDELKNMEFKLIANTDFYAKENGQWHDLRKDAEAMKNVVKNGSEIRIVGIVMPKEDSSITNQGIGYTTDLSAALIEKNNQAQIVREQKENPETDILSGKPFSAGNENEQPDLSALSPEEQAYFASLSPEEQQAMLKQMSSSATYEGNLAAFGVADPDTPSLISVFPKNFEAKNGIENFVKEYNQTVEEDDRIIYTDYVKMMMSSITSVIDVISTILISFVAVSLVVSSIMIGIITYISVLERTKEIGILRSIGASKKDISRVFNAETTIVGFAAGAIGILITLLLTIPANLIVSAMTGVSGVVALPWQGAVILVAISIILTFIAGLIPAGMAAKKDPVVALRTE